MTSTMKPPTKSDPVAFRAFMEKRRAGKGKKAVPTRPIPLVKPTEERLDKEDRPRKMDAGFYRAPAPIERLRDHRKLDPLPHINEAMFQAASKLHTVFYLGGLGGIGAQDLSRCVGGADGTSSGFPHLGSMTAAAPDYFGDGCSAAPSENYDAAMRVMREADANG